MEEISTVLASLTQCYSFAIAVAIGGALILGLIIYSVTMQHRLRSVKSRDDRWR